MTNLVPVNGNNELIEFSDEQKEIIKGTVAQGLSDFEFKFFLEVAKRSGLDPFQRQIHAVKRQGKLCIQTGIDGFRVIAARTREYAGQEEKDFEYEGNGKFPVRARCTVYRLVQGHRVPFTATCRWAEFYPGDKQGFMWRDKPEVMLGKCVEAQALRMAFPAETKGLYEEAELQRPVKDGPTRADRLNKPKDVSEAVEVEKDDSGPNMEASEQSPSEVLIKGKRISEHTIEELQALLDWADKNKYQAKKLQPQIDAIYAHLEKVEQ